jgi:phospholipid/cholesterol/gamma-HCH transport system ATP-binding protein
VVLQGDVIILGKKRQGLLMDDPELADKLKIGLVFQNGALFDSLTVGENVGFQLIEHSHLPPSRIKVRSASM